MAIDLDNIDFNDPCALVPVYREALAIRELGLAVVTSQVGRDRIDFNAVKVEDLRAALVRIEAQCAAKQTGKPIRRRALSTGFRR